MRKLGIILAALGIVWAIVAFNLRTTVVTESQTIGTGQFAVHIPSTEVNNIGLLDNRRNQLLIAALFAVAGVLLFGFGSISNSSLGTRGTRSCPFCAERIKVEAIKCRYCNSEVRPESAAKAGAAVSESPATITGLHVAAEWVKGKNLILKIVPLVLVVGVWVLYLPTTLDLDHSICRSTRVKSDGTWGEVWQENMKQCMAIKRHGLKPVAIMAVMEKNALENQKIAGAKAEILRLDSQHSDPNADRSSIIGQASMHMNRTLRSVQEIQIDSAKSTMEFNMTHMFLDPVSWD